MAVVPVWGDSVFAPGIAVFIFSFSFFIQFSL
jgi:hypothetical protein